MLKVEVIILKVEVPRRLFRSWSCYFSLDTMRVIETAAHVDTKHLEKSLPLII